MQHAFYTRLRSPSTHYTGAKTTTLHGCQFHIDYNLKSLHSCARSTTVIVLGISQPSQFHVRCGSTRPTFQVYKGGSFSSYSHEPWKTSLFSSLCGTTAYRRHWHSLTVINNFVDSWKLTILMLHFCSFKLTTFYLPCKPYLSFFYSLTHAPLVWLTL